MPASIDHRCFIQPPSEDIKLWRYMDFTKFVSLISSQTLFFCRSDLFEDPYEGSYSKANLKLRPYVYTSMQSSEYESMANNLANFSKNIRQHTYINCWHVNEYESAAMWKLYAKTNESIAIVTDYETLKNSLEEKIYLGLVTYIDYEKDWLPEGNSFYPFLHKRKSFEHEKEARAIIQELSMNESKMGLNIQIDMNKLIKEIYVSPDAPSWIVDLTEEIAKKYGVNAIVLKSDLGAAPVF